MGWRATQAPRLLLSSPIIADGQVQLGFLTPTGFGTTFQLLEAARPTGPWGTNETAVFSINQQGVSYTFTVPYAAVLARFFRVQAQ